MARHLAAQFAMIGFATAALDGAMDGLAFSDTIQVAMKAGVMFFFLGLITGDIARRLVEEHSEQILKRELERPESSDDETETEESQDEQQPVEQEVPQAA